MAALKGKARSPQTEFRRAVKQKVDYPIEKLMQDNISVKWGGKADHCIMAFAPLSKHDAENMFKTKWQYDMKSSSNKPCDSDATIAGKNANLFLDSPPAAFGFMWDGHGQIKFCAQNMHYLKMQIAWLRANAEATEWPDEVEFAEDLPDEYHSGKRIAIDIFGDAVISPQICGSFPPHCITLYRTVSCRITSIQCCHCIRLYYPVEKGKFFF